MQNTRHIGLVFLKGLFLFSLGCGADGSGLITMSPTALIRGDVDPRLGNQELTLSLQNSGDADSTIRWAGVETVDDTCGTFFLPDSLANRTIGIGDTMDIKVLFEPHPDAQPGCACHAAGRLRLSLEGEPPNARIPLIVSGACSTPLQCTTNHMEFDKAIIEYSHEQEVRCYNLKPEAVLIQKAALSAETNAYFSLESTEPTLPTPLEMGEYVGLNITYLPLTTGTHTGKLTITLQDSQIMEVLITALAGRERPLCADGIPADPPPALLKDDYTITLESNTLSTYSGILRSFWNYANQPPLIGDYLVTTGVFSEPACDVGQNGHQYYWKDCEPQPDDTIVNIHAVPHSPTVEEWLLSLSVWDDVTIRGYEVKQISYTNNSWWKDAGCNTLIVTWVCDN